VSSIVGLQWFRLVSSKLMAGGFRAVKINFQMRAIAERFVGRLAAAAKRILLLRRVFLSSR